MSTTNNRYPFQRALRAITRYRRDNGLLDGDGSPQSETRRNFMAVSAVFGTSAALAAAGAGALVSREAAAQSASEDQTIRDNAEYSMVLATAYRVGTTRSYPMMQLHFKENLQNATNRRVYVDLRPAGQLGAGATLAERVQTGTIQAAQHSLSNFAPFAPQADLINIPYWVGLNQEFVNLTTSATWDRVVNAAVRERGYEPLFYVTIDPRTAAMRKGLRDEPFRTPDDMRGIKFRVPASEMLQQLYQLLGANPTPVAWGETTSAIRQGVADALDPSLGALYVFGFAEILSYVTFNAAVPDAQVYSCNAEWFNGLPTELRDGVKWASELTFLQNIAQVPAARTHAMMEMTAAGVQFYTPTAEERAQWIEACGHQRAEWNTFKERLAGSLGAFEELHEAATTMGRYYVHDVGA